MVQVSIDIMSQCDVVTKRWRCIIWEQLSDITIDMKPVMLGSLKVTVVRLVGAELDCGMPHAG